MVEVHLEAADMRRTIGRIAHEVLEKNKGSDNLVVIGVLKRGLPVAKRLAFAMTQIEGVTIPCGSLDIRAYRDDRPDEEPPPDDSEIPFAVTDKTVILVDEVLQTGRTVRAAMDAIMRHGRPANIQLSVLVDRGGRELPIEANYVGTKLDVEDDEYIEVFIAEADGEDAVRVRKGDPACTS